MADTPKTETRTRSGLFSQTEPLGHSFFELYGSLWQQGLLDPQLKEAVRLRNARITDCGF